MITPQRRPLNLTWLFVLAAVSDAAAAALTLVIPDVLNGPPVMNGSAQGTALIMLVLGVPILLGSLWLDAGTSRWAAVVRIGVLAYLAYNCFLLLTATPFNRLFLIYVVALSSTAFSLGASLLLADPNAIGYRLSARPARVLGAYIWLIVAFNVAAWLGKVIPATLAEDPMAFLDGTGLTTNPIFVQDLVFWLPSAALIGWLAWTRRPRGALLAGAYLVYGLIESIGVATDQWIGSSADPTSDVATREAALLFVVLAVIGIGALLYYVRELRGSDLPRQSGQGVSIAG